MTEQCSWNRVTEQTLAVYHAAAPDYADLPDLHVVQPARAAN